MTNQDNELHQGQPVLAAGEKLSEARAAMVLVHGRGATAESILTLATDRLKQLGTFCEKTAADFFDAIINSTLPKA